MSNDKEILLDDSAYPIVRLYPERVTTMDRFLHLDRCWHRVVERGNRFALISYGDHPDDEPKEVTRERALFFKQNRLTFQTKVAVIVNVEPDPVLRRERMKEAEKAGASLGFRIAVVPSEAEAITMARSCLGGSS